jgi:hypothetical protein
MRLSNKRSAHSRTESEPASREAISKKIRIDAEPWLNGVAYQRTWTPVHRSRRPPHSLSVNPPPSFLSSADFRVRVTSVQCLSSAVSNEHRVRSDAASPYEINKVTHKFILDKFHRVAEQVLSSIESRLGCGLIT